MRKLLVFISLIGLLSCNTAVKPRNSNLVVHYQGDKTYEALKEIKDILQLPTITRDPTAYWNKKNFAKKIWRDEKTYVVFGADWCKPCVELKSLLVDAGIADRIIYLDSSEPWVAKILTDLEYIGIPYTVVYQNGKPTGVIRVGLHSSLIFLVANVR